MGKYKKKDLEYGTTHEMEHKDTIALAMARGVALSESPYHHKPNIYDMRNIATEIALDHLKEDPKYYQKLKKVGL